MKIELINPAPQLEKIYKKIVSKAIQKGLITEDEWNNRFKDYRDECGYSFIHYLESIMYNMDCFITCNKLMLDNRNEFEKRFGVKIVKPGEL